MINVLFTKFCFVSHEYMLFNYNVLIHTDIFFNAFDMIGTGSRLTVATNNSGMNISNAAHHSSNSRSTACFRPGGRSLGSGDIESHLSTDMAVIVNTLAATATPRTKKKGNNFYNVICEVEMELGRAHL